MYNIGSRGGFWRHGKGLCSIRGHVCSQTSAGGFHLTVPPSSCPSEGLCWGRLPNPPAHAGTRGAPVLGTGGTWDIAGHLTLHLKVLISLLRHFCGNQLFFMSFTLPLDLFSLFLTPPVSCASNGSPNVPVAVTTESRNVRG